MEETSMNHVVDWLLDQDPSIRWRAQRDLAGAPEAEWSSTRARVAHDGRGAALLALRGPDGQWSGGSFVPKGFDWSTLDSAGQPWTATCWALQELREMGVVPAALHETVQLIAAHSRWDHAGQPYWDGEVEECINGRTVADGAYFGVDVSPIVTRLLGEQMRDGGWNCERENGATVGSFDSTINVLEGLLVYETTQGGDAASAAARASAEEYLLSRSLYRGLRSGAPIAEFLALRCADRWHYSVLRALEYFRAAGRYDARLAEAIDWLRAQSDDGLYRPTHALRGATLVLPDAPVGEPSPRLTLVAQRVLAWWDGHVSG